MRFLSSHFLSIITDSTEKVKKIFYRTKAYYNHYILRILSVVFHISEQTTCISSDIFKQTRRVKKYLFLHCKADNEVDCQI